MRGLICTATSVWDFLTDSHIEMWISSLYLSLSDLDLVCSLGEPAKALALSRCLTTDWTVRPVLCQTQYERDRRETVKWSEKLSIGVGHQHCFVLFFLTNSNSISKSACIWHSGTCYCSHTGNIDGCAFKVVKNIAWHF